MSRRRPDDSRHRAEDLVPEYVFSAEEAEFQRLVEQGRFLGDLTRRLFVDAGIGPGMRVLDIGCGMGDVSLIAAELVGPAGAVVGVDISCDTAAAARRRLAAAGAANVRVVEGDLAALSLEGEFDAVVGRLILMYMADPAAILASVARYLRPGGILASQEMDFTAPSPSYPASPLWERLGGWWRAASSAAGAEQQMGLKLYGTYLAAGLPAPALRMDARVGGGPDFPIYEWGAEAIRGVIPLLERFGIATADEVQVDTLADRLRDEVVAGGGVIGSPPLVGAWTRKP